MAIRFPCPRCGKIVKAPDAAGGKRGKCPYCGEKMLVPLANSPPTAVPSPPTATAAAAPAATPPANLGYDMAPSDKNGDDLKQKLIKQAMGMANDLDDNVPSASVPSPVKPVATPKKETRFTSEQITAMSSMDCITSFLTLMSESKLEDAARFVGRMKKAKRREVQKMLGGLDPTSLTSGLPGDVPPPVLKVFLTQMECQLR